MDSIYSPSPSPSPSPQPQPQLRAYSGEDKKTDSAYQAASDPVGQAAHAAPVTANVPFMYNNNHGPSRVETGSAEAGPVTYGSDSDLQRRERQPGAAPADEYFQYAPSRDQIRARAQPQQGGVGSDSPQSPPAPTRVDLTQRFEDDNVRIQYTPDTSPRAQPGQGTLEISTGGGDDFIHIEETRGGLLAQINGRSYEIPYDERPGTRQAVAIDTGGGNDGVSIGYGGTRETFIYTGSGNDTVYAGSGKTNVYGGSGSDVINLGSGESYAEGNDGNDFITGGSGNAVIYGGRGSDELRAGGGPSTKTNYVDGGQDNDVIYGGKGHNILHGGAGDDVIIGDVSGSGTNTIYTGRGRDIVDGYNKNDRIFSRRGVDDLSQIHPESRVYDVIPADPSLGRRGIKIEGTSEFKQRVEDDLEFMRGSPVGQGVLAKVDSLKAPIKIRQGFHGNFYDYSDPSAGVTRSDENRRADYSDGFVRDGVAGTPATNPVLTYQPNFIVPGDQRPPVVVLQHELGHAINFGEGSALAGETFSHFNVVGYDQNGSPRYGAVYEDNHERQVVGLPTSHPPYKFEPNLPASTYNVWPFTENALLAELGLPLRRSYLPMIQSLPRV